MHKKIIFMIALFLIFFQIKAATSQELNYLDKILVVPVDKKSYQTQSPNPQRGEEYNRFLSASVKVFVPESTGFSGSSGSGTIIYYDSSKKLAYIASCGQIGRAHV